MEPAIAVQYAIRTARRLLEFLTGECSSWQMAFASALQTEGMGSTLIKVETKLENEMCETDPEKYNTCYMLVKNWGFEGAGNGEKFPWKGTQVKDEAGVAGQGVNNPRSYFENHEIVEVSIAESKNKLYDPSYGNGPVEGALGLEPATGMGAEAEDIRKKFEEHSIAGFCILKGEYKCRKTSEGVLLLFFKGPLKLNVESEPEEIMEAGEQPE